LLQYGAVALFVQRAQAISRAFRLSEENASAIAEICARLDGLPLALELAAARTRLLSPQQLLARLQKPLDVLTQGGPDLPPRQQTLRATIAWSYELLSGEEQRAFRCLSVFAGGCTLDAAEALCAAVGDGSTPVLDLVQGLVEHALLQRVNREGKEPRLLMLETIRQYGLERFEEGGEAERVRQAHAAYYLHLAERAKPTVHEMHQSSWLEQLEREHDNLRVAQALTAMRANNISVQLQTRAKALYAAGWLAYQQADFEQARRFSQESIDLLRAVGDRQGLANALHLLATVESGPDKDYTAGNAFLEESQRLFLEVGDEMGAVTVGVTLGTRAFFQGEFERAATLYEESLAVFRARGESWYTAMALHYLSWVTYCRGEYAAARRLSEESIALIRPMGHTVFTVEVLVVLAYEVAALGERAAASMHLEEALALAKQEESAEDTALANCGLGHLALRQGEMAQALARYEESLSEIKGLWTTARLTIRMKWIPATCLEGLGEIALARGQAALTARLFAAAEVWRSSGAQFNPVGIEQPTYAETLAAAHAQLGKGTFAARWAEGRAMAPVEVLAALEALSGSWQGEASAPGQHPSPSSAPAPSWRRLTTRELEVLRLLAAGLTNQQISERLVISTRTVNIHVSSIYKKLEVSSRAAATRYAMDHGLVG
jgi:DNA-binding CsgD family transcriptional regulator/tetratricopeptide (TPR) repeat protein